MAKRAKGGVTIKGGPETARAFGGLADDVSNLQSTHEKVVRARLDGIARRTPVATGALAASWQSSATNEGGSITSDLPYAAAIEYGSVRGVTGAHMVEDTLKAEESEVLEEYRRAILDRAKARGFRIG